MLPASLGQSGICIEGLVIVVVDQFLRAQKGGWRVSESAEQGRGEVGRRGREEGRSFQEMMLLLVSD